MKVENFSPLDRITGVMCGAPGTEAVLGLMMPASISLFEPDACNTASVVEARRDHIRMTDKFGDDGIQVFNMRKIIGKKLAENACHSYQTPNKLLNEIFRRAELLHQHYSMGDLNQFKYEICELLFADVMQMGPDAAIAINGVLTNCIDIDGSNKPFKINDPPAANFMFWRDTNHVVGSEATTHTMFYSIRQQEVKLAELGMEALGVEYKKIQLNGKGGSIEGGDVLPMELNGKLYALIGKAERTSWSGVYAWFELHEALFKQSGHGLIPAVVEGPSKNTQDQMHLDTFCQQIAPGAIIHCGEISRNRVFSVLARKHGTIEKIDCQNFADWIENNATHVHDMCRDDQLRYAPNVLVNGGETVYITRDDTPDVVRFIRNHVSRAVLLHMSNLTKLYGGAHCATSEFRCS